MWFTANWDEGNSSLPKGTINQKVISVDTYQTAEIIAFPIFHTLKSLEI